MVNPVYMSKGRGLADLLVRFDGLNGQRRAFDHGRYGFPISFSGSTRGLSTAVKKFGTASLEPSAPSGDDVYWTGAAKIPLTDKPFSVECWVYFQSYINVENDFIQGESTWNFGVYASGADIRMYFYTVTDGVGLRFPATNFFTKPALNTWHHFRVLRISDDLHFFMNGANMGVVSVDAGAGGGGVITTPSNTGHFASGSSGEAGDYFIDELRLLRGNTIGKLTTSLAAPTAAYTGNEPYLSSLLFHFDGTNGSQSFPDSSGYGSDLQPNTSDPVLDTSQKKFGTASLRCSNSGGIRVTADKILQMYRADFTVECWVKVNSSSAYGTICGLWDNGSGAKAWWCGEKDGALAFAYISPDTNFHELISSPVTLTDDFHHVAWVRHDGTVTIYLDGVAITSQSSVVSINSGVGYNVWVGADGDASNKFDGWIDELRVTVGVARYTRNFAPPTGPFAS